MFDRKSIFFMMFFCVKNYGPQNSNKQNLNKSYIRVLCKIYQSYRKTLYIFPDNMIYMWIFINMPDVFAKYVYNMENNLFCVEYLCRSLQHNIKLEHVLYASMKIYFLVISC